MVIGTFLVLIGITRQRTLAAMANKPPIVDCDVVTQFHCTCLACRSQCEGKFGEGFDLCSVSLGLAA
jgi:hypothetical protein